MSEQGLSRWSSIQQCVVIAHVLRNVFQPPDRWIHWRPAPEPDGRKVILRFAAPVKRDQPQSVGRQWSAPAPLDKEAALRVKSAKKRRRESEASSEAAQSGGTLVPDRSVRPLAGTTDVKGEPDRDKRVTGEVQEPWAQTMVLRRGSAHRCVDGESQSACHLSHKALEASTTSQCESAVGWLNPSPARRETPRRIGLPPKRDVIAVAASFKLAQRQRDRSVPRRWHVLRVNGRLGGSHALLCGRPRHRVHRDLDPLQRFAVGQCVDSVPPDRAGSKTIESNEDISRHVRRLKVVKRVR
jgi:hypothetical protein